MSFFDLIVLVGVGGPLVCCVVLWVVGVALDHQRHDAAHAEAEDAYRNDTRWAAKGKK